MSFVYRVSKIKSLCFLPFLLFLLNLVSLSCSLLDPKQPKCVFEVGKNLTMRLSDTPWGDKEDLINDLTDYYVYINTAFRVEDKNYPASKKMIQKLKARGGPPFFKVDIKDEFLKSKYEMGVVEIDHVKELIQDIRKIWSDIENGVEVPPEFENY